MAARMRQPRALLASRPDDLSTSVAAILQRCGWRVDRLAQSDHSPQVAAMAAEVDLVACIDVPANGVLAQALAGLRHDASAGRPFVVDLRHRVMGAGWMSVPADDAIDLPAPAQLLEARLQGIHRSLAFQRQQHQALAARHAELAREIDAVRRVQQRQMRGPLVQGGYRLEGACYPSGAVGGDFYDFAASPNGLVTFCVGDVTGHGVRAATLALAAQALLRAGSQDLLRRRHSDPTDAVLRMLARCNAQLLAMNLPSMFLTLVYGLLDTRDGSLVLVNLGHPPPLLAGDGDDFGSVCTGGVPLGVLERPEWEAVRLVLPRGARLVAYSDGVTDCTDALGQQYPLARLRHGLARSRRQPAADVAAVTMQDLRAWRQDAPEDDVAVLVVDAA